LRHRVEPQAFYGKGNGRTARRAAILFRRQQNIFTAKEPIDAFARRMTGG
jgi:hypothetical protein